MNSDLKNYFEINEEAFYINDKDERKFRGVRRYYGDSIRNDKADKQAQLCPVSISKVFSYVNDFLELIRFDGGATKRNTRYESIELDCVQQMVLDNGIIARGCNWNSPRWDKIKQKYTYHDKKYDVIQDRFQLANPYDIAWLKFTTKGHLGVVAKSFDINYKDDVSSDVLVKQVGEEWDKSFVLIFPLTSEILKNNYTSGDIELGIGNYLISKKVPIIDYYSHNN